MGRGHFESNSCGRELLVLYDFPDFAEYLLVQHREELRTEQKYMLLPPKHLPGLLRPTAEGRPGLAVMPVCLVALGMFAFSEVV